jgi:hypothetical protein
MLQKPKCAHKRLAAEGCFTVDLCDCGAIHLTLGFATLRLEPAAYRELAYAIVRGLHELNGSTGAPLH